MEEIPLRYELNSKTICHSSRKQNQILFKYEYMFRPKKTIIRPTLHKLLILHFCLSQEYKISHYMQKYVVSLSLSLSPLSRFIPETGKHFSAMQMLTSTTIFGRT